MTHAIEMFFDLIEYLLQEMYMDSPLGITWL
jgi:hypothetical protein